MDQPRLDSRIGRRLAVLTALFLAAIATLAPSRAHAQASPEAEKLFRDGKALMKAGKLAEACVAFEASERSEHNIATVMSLADCREKNQQYASAWAGFLQADSQTRQDASKSGVAINAVAKKRAAALETRLSYLTINVPDEAQVEGLVVRRDDVVIERGAWNRTMPVDGGEHVIAGSAPGHEAWSTKITVGPENDKQQVEVPKFKELPKLVNPPIDPFNPLPIVPAPSPFTTRRKIGLGIATGGAVVAGVSIVLGAKANSQQNEALTKCLANNCTQDQAAAATALNDKARKNALVANIGLGVAGAALTAAVVLWFTGAPHVAEETAPVDETAFRIAPVFGGDTNGFVLSRSF